MRRESNAPFTARRSVARCVFAIFGILATVILVSCTLAERPSLPTENLLTPAVLPTPVFDSENAPLQPPDAERGALTYEQKCAACHGASGKGDGPRAAQIKTQGKVVANLVEPSRFRAAKPGDWHQIITDGRIQNLMPPFGQSLDAQQRWDVQAYIWSLGSSPENLEAGKTIYEQQCAACHGENGETAVGDPQQAFNDMRWLANHSLLDISSGLSRGNSHQGIALDETQRFQVADYVHSLAYRYADPEAVRQARTHGDGVLNLRAVNGTPNGPPARKLPVTLRVYDANGEVFSRTNSLNDQSSITFSSLPRRPDYFYQAELDYGGGRFYASPVQLPVTGTNAISDVLPFFETTTDDSAISIGEMHTFVQNVSEGELTMVDYYLFDNASDRAFIGAPGPEAPEGKRRTLKIGVPADARNIRFDGLGLGQRFFQDGDVIHDTDVVVPGQRAAAVAMIYEVPYRGGRVSSRKVFYPVKQWDALLPAIEAPNDALLVTSQNVTDRGIQQTPAGNLRLYVGNQPIQAGSTLSFDITGQPRGAPVPGADTRAIGLGFIAFAVAVGLGYFLLTRARAMRKAYTGGSELREQLLREMAELDDDYTRGKLKEPAYLKQRAQLKEELKKIWE
jgi:mono/diheme cytochrome c family protein